MDSDPEPQSVVWERMNLPIARGLRGLIYVLSDLSQVDPSDLSTLFAGHGRLRIGFSEIDPSASHEPDDKHVEDAVRRCWQNSYYAFSKPVGTSLVCIQGDWSNVVDAKIKSGLAAFASGSAPDNPYTPLYARATHAPKPWGVTALFAEYTGNHPPLAIDWTSGTKGLTSRRRSRQRKSTRLRPMRVSSRSAVPRRRRRRPCRRMLLRRDETADLRKVARSPAHRGHSLVCQPLGVRRRRQPRRSRGTRPGGRTARSLTSRSMEERSGSFWAPCGFAPWFPGCRRNGESESWRRWWRARRFRITS